MRTKKLNVFEAQRNWMLQHRHADALMCDKDGLPMKAVYKSPLENWKGLVALDGTVNVPDMDYYNSLIDPEDTSEAMDEIFLKEKN